MTDRTTHGRLRARGLCASVALAAIIAAHPALAQDTVEGAEEKAPEELEFEEIIVTGSRISRAGFDTLQAAFVTDSEDINLRGYTNVGDALQDVPGFGISDSSPVGTAQSTLGVAQTFVNFFGLGSQRTLTLVNGRRFVSSNTVSGSGAAASPGSQVDLNVIPAGLIDRVETVAIGGAPVYGADAIAGTVNLILKDDFEGVETSVQYGVTNEGDGESYMAHGLIGGNFGEDDRGNVTLAVEYTKQNGFRLSDRMPFRYLLPNPEDTSDSDGIPSRIVVDDLRYAVLTEGGLPYDNQLVPLAGLDLPGIVFPPIYTQGNYIRSADGTPLQFGANGNLVPLQLGEVVQSALGAPVLTDGGDGVNPAEHFSLLSPTERTLINGMGHYDLTPWLTVFTEVAYAHTEGTELSELYQFAAPAALGGPELTFSVDNAFLSQSARDIIAANGLTDFNLNRNLNDVVDQTPGRTSLDLYRIVTGFEGNFLVGDQNWAWDLSFNYGRSESMSELTMINPDRLLLAIDAVRDDNGNVVCASGGECVPINLFGMNNFSAEAVDYVTDRGRAVSVNTQKAVTANITGSLPFGFSEPIAFNVGYEHREEDARFSPDATLEAGILLLGPGTLAFEGVEGGFKTNEYYGEVEVPIFSPDQDTPLIKAMSINGAIRYVDNSIAGGATTWSVGGRIAPRLPGILDGLVLRGVFTHSIRAPAITELFLGGAPTANAITDVCNAQNYNQGPNPSVREANCRAALAAVGGPAPEDFESTTSAVSAFGVQAGNPNLQNETADSWSLGFVFQPEQIPGFRLAVDWSEIKLENGIETLGIGALMASCYDSENYPNEQACSAFGRLTAAQAAAQPGPTRATGDVANGYRTGYYNISSLNFAGLIAQADYSFGIKGFGGESGEGGTVRLGAHLFYTDKYEQVSQPGSPSIDNAGTVGTPDFRGTFRAGYSEGPVGVDLQALWTASVVQDQFATIENLPEDVLSIGDYWRFNGTLRYDVFESLQAQVSVNNIFNKAPPYSAQVTRAFGAYSPIGRTFLFRLTARF
ncbi:TonB-dependent receptor domain-containing protein [Kordiimonas sp.]|uniref:TonB-dependent receptor domain-containing protein n=1 Tax=Kordiimonas sp. TaxID=1970157 RepID=UPI003A91D014